MLTEDDLHEIKQVVRDEIEVEAKSIKIKVGSTGTWIEAQLIDLKNEMKDLNIKLKKLYELQMEEY